MCVCVSVCERDAQTHIEGGTVLHLIVDVLIYSHFQVAAMSKVP